jgi:outer membrane protein TolC
MAGTLTIRLGLLVAGLAAWTVPAGAQTQAPLTLANAVKVSLDKAPLVQMAREDVNVQKAVVRETRGAFDAILQVSPLFAHRENRAEFTAYLQPEKIKRGLAEGLARSFGLVADSLAASRATGRGDLPLCPTDGNYSAYVATFPGSVLPVPLCRPAASALGTSSFGNIDNAGDENTWLYRRPLTFDPMSTTALQSALASLYQVKIQSQMLDARERANEMLWVFEVASRQTQAQSALVFDRLGDLPTYIYTQTLSFSGEFDKPFRNGSILQVKATIDGKGTMFRAKPIDPTFGGAGTPNLFSDRVQAFWIQPLMRGRGRDTVEAAERAAKKNVEASQYGYQQTNADQALATVDAYLALVAAQESFALTNQSLETQRRLLEATIKLVAAGEVPSADVARARASTSRVESDLESARLSVVAARTTLADVMGVPGDAMVGLTAADAFPTQPLAADLEEAAKNATARRADVRAAAAFRETNQILLKAAKANTRPRFDFSLSVGGVQSYSGPPFLSLPDELGSRVPKDSYVTYYNLGGVGRAFDKKWEPIVTIGGIFELPFGNNQRLGRFAEAMASLRDSEIRLEDLTRTIHNDVPRYAEQVRRARLEWQQRQEAVVQYEATWDAAQRLRAAGEMTLIDTLLTEQLLTQARLQLVQAKRDYASALARYRRETGTLLNIVDGAVGQPELAGLVATR